MLKGMRGRLILKTGSVLFIFLIITVGVVGFLFRKSVIENSKENAITIAEIVRDSLTSLMVLGVMEQRDTFLDQIKVTRGLERLRIIRGPAVIKQFGAGEEKENPITPLEKEVLVTGKIKDRLVENKEWVIYELVIPYRATSGGKVNCLQCHAVKEGEVLGAISLAVDLTQKRKEGFLLLGIYAGTSGILFLFFLTVRHFEPYRKLFSDMKVVLGRFKEGDFKERIYTQLRDEAGELAQVINNVGKTLDKTLSNVRQKVSMLIGYSVVETENALKDTEKIVDELVKISHFKRTIEQDIRKADIYIGE